MENGKQPKMDASSSEKKMNTGKVLKIIHPASAPRNEYTFSSQVYLNSGGIPIKLQAAKTKPDASIVSPKKKLRTGTESKRSQPVLVQPDVFSFPSQVLWNTGAKAKKVQPTKEPDVSKLSRKKKARTSTNSKKIHPALAQPDEAASPSKKSGRPMEKRLAQVQVGTPKIVTAPGTEMMDYQSSRPSTSRPTIEELVLTGTWIDGDKKCMQFVGNGNKFLVPTEPPAKLKKMSALGIPFYAIESTSGRNNPQQAEKTIFPSLKALEAPLNFIESLDRKNLPQEEAMKSPDHKEDLYDSFEYPELTELPENIFESSDEEESYVRIRDVFKNSDLTGHQQRIEERLTKAYVEGTTHWQFLGKGSSDVHIPVYGRQVIPLPVALDLPMDRLELWAHQNFKGEPDIVVD